MAQIIDIKLPAVVTIANVSNRDVPFAPKGQNFTITIKAGDSFKFTVNKAEDVMYYFGQAVDGVLEVSQEAAE